MFFDKNPEVKHTLRVTVMVSLVMCVGAAIISPPFAIYTFLCCVVFSGIYFTATYKRYKRIARLAEKLDELLHNGTQLALEEYSEGELAILQSELQKMTSRLYEQEASLTREKEMLANSIADISHQLRTPLTAMHLQVSMLSDSNISDERRAELMNSLSVFLKRMDWLIEALLKLSRLDAGTVRFQNENITLAELLERACAPLLIPIELRGQTLEINAQGSAECDVAWCCEAIANILKNCMEHTPEGGILTINALETPLYSEISVSDTGMGISADDLPHIFERFYKGKDAGAGSIGIGLALARMIVVGQNGTLKAENLHGGGAKFTIRLYKCVV